MDLESHALIEVKRLGPHDGSVLNNVAEDTKILFCKGLLTVEVEVAEDALEGAEILNAERSTKGLGLDFHSMSFSPLLECRLTLQCQHGLAISGTF